MRRAQVTTFVVLGIVLITVFGLALLARSLIIENNTQHKADKLLKDSITTSPFPSYVTSCLERTAQLGVQQMLLQGGYLYNNSEQFGSIDQKTLVEGVDYLPFLYNGTFYNVTYGIKKNTLCNLSTSFAYPPEYPYPYTALNYSILETLYKNPANGICRSFRQDSGFFGLNDLPRLCDANGANRRTNTTVSGATISCDPDFYNKPYFPDQKEMQSQLEYYMEQHLTRCVDLANFSRHSAMVLSINAPKVTVTYGAKDISLKATYAFKVQVGQDTASSYYDFSTKLNIPIQNLYRCAFTILSKDSQDIMFNKTLSVPSLPACQTYLYKEYRQACGYGPCANDSKDDIIELQDTSTKIDGIPLTFHIAVKNRRPALDYIHDPSIAANYQADLQYKQEEEILLKPKGYDPDELNLWFKYAGWKENYEELYNSSCCQQPGMDCSVNLSLCMIKLNISNNNWSNSVLFQQNHQDANYKTQAHDVGLHIVNISVWDREGLLDYQQVRILVFDLPIAVINSTNGYADINTSDASFEDPYNLSAKESTKSTLLSEGNLSGFLWNDSTQPFYIPASQAIITIPEDDFHSYQSIDASYPHYIVEKIFNKTGPHNISLIVVQNSSMGSLYSLPTSTIVNVYACLPHRSQTAPYPYNNLTTSLYTPNVDPYQGSHVCCINASETTMAAYNMGGYGNYKPSGINCFTYTEYGYYYSWTDLPTATDPHTAINGVVPQIYQDKNDIYKREFDRACSGSRGNTCDGDVTETRTLQEACTGYIATNNAAGQPMFTESCQGPSSTIAVGDKAAIYCQNYTAGSSFETAFNLKDVQGNTATGTCRKDPVCTNTVQSLFTSTATGQHGAGMQGPYGCLAQCDGKGGCTTPLPSSCLCKSTTDVYGNTCSADPNCNNFLPNHALSLTGNQKNESFCTQSCTVQSCAPYIFDTSTNQCKRQAQSDMDCDDGYKKDNSNLNCVKPGTIPGTDNTGTCEFVYGAPLVCDEKAPGSSVCSGFVKTATCSPTNCQTIPMANICSSSCGASSECDGKAPNSCSTVNNKRCNAQCVPTTDASCRIGP